MKHGNNVVSREKGGLESFAKLHDFLGAQPGDTVDFGAVFARVAKQIGSSVNERGVVQITIGDEDKGQSWELTVTNEGCEVRKGKAKPTRFEILVKSSSARDIASGKISPIFAMARGHLRVKGDLEFGKRIYKLLAADNGRIDPCK